MSRHTSQADNNPFVKVWAGPVREQRLPALDFDSAAYENAQVAEACWLLFQKVHALSSRVSRGCRAWGAETSMLSSRRSLLSAGYVRAERVLFSANVEFFCLTVHPTGHARLDKVVHTRLRAVQSRQEVHTSSVDLPPCKPRASSWSASASPGTGRTHGSARAPSCGPSSSG